MVLYALKAGFVWLVLYIIYALFLQRERFFGINRSYLLLALVAGIGLPMIEIETSNNYIPQLPILLHEITVNAEQNLAAAPNLQYTYWNYTLILIAIYGIGVIIAAVRLGLSLLKIHQLYQKARIENHASYALVKTNELHSPFSFGKYLFISNRISLSNKEYEYILKHETTHIFQNHTLDIMLIEVLSILFWFNPLLVLYKSALRDQHEYLADQAVLHHAPIKEYGQLLIEQSIPGLKIGLVNHLIYSQLKKRINMMTKKHSSKVPYLRYATSLFAFVLVFWTVSCQKDLKNETEEIVAENTGKVYTVVNEMPYMKSAACEGTDKKCTDHEMLKFIYNNIKYPKQAKENGTEGMTVISFVVDKHGSIKDIKTVREVADGCSEEAIRVIQLMKGKWVPGKKDGKVVSVRYNLPIRFKLK